MNYCKAAKLSKLFLELADVLFWEEVPEHYLGGEPHGYKVDTTELRAKIEKALEEYHAKVD